MLKKINLERMSEYTVWGYRQPPTGARSQESYYAVTLKPTLLSASADNHSLDRTGFSLSFPSQLVMYQMMDAIEEKGGFSEV